MSGLRMATASSRCLSKTIVAPLIGTGTVYIIEIGLERTRFVVLVYFFPHLNMQKPADYGPQQYQELFIKV